MLPTFFFVLLHSESVCLACRFCSSALNIGLDCEDPNVIFILSFLEPPSSYKDFTDDFDTDRYRTRSVVSRLRSL